MFEDVGRMTLNQPRKAPVDLTRKERLQIFAFTLKPLRRDAGIPPNDPS
jgi:hypothetical protein